jgi:hypothetical protein
LTLDREIYHPSLLRLQTNCVSASFFNPFTLPLPSFFSSFFSPTWPPLYLPLNLSPLRIFLSSPFLLWLWLWLWLWCSELKSVLPAIIQHPLDEILPSRTLQLDFMDEGVWMGGFPGYLSEEASEMGHRIGEFWYDSGWFASGEVMKGSRVTVMEDGSMSGEGANLDAD